jgi:hypothetical protein
MAAPTFAHSSIAGSAQQQIMGCAGCNHSGGSDGCRGDGCNAQTQVQPLEEAIAAAQAEVPHSNYYTEAYSAPLRHLISQQLEVPESLIHINAGSELILRQIFDRLGQQVHLLTPTYPLFPEIAPFERPYAGRRLYASYDCFARRQRPIFDSS